MKPVLLLLAVVAFGWFVAILAIVLFIVFVSVVAWIVITFRSATRKQRERIDHSPARLVANLARSRVPTTSDS